MCGRLSQDLTWQEIHDLYDIHSDKRIGGNLGRRQNIAPTQDLLFAAHPSEETELMVGRWWLVPSWAKEVDQKFSMFNAKSETAYKLPSFRSAFKSRRCLIPTDGFYEWKQAEDGGRDPFFIHLNHTPISLAGLWEINTVVADEPLVSCTILTMPSAGEVLAIHDRMPVVLKKDAWGAWLDPATSVEGARNLLKDNHSLDLTAYRVDRKVNASSYNGDDCKVPSATK